MQRHIGKNKRVLGEFDVSDVRCLRKMPYGQHTQAEWDFDRFEQWHEGNVTVVSGSTAASQKRHREEKGLNAVTSIRDYDGDGVLQKVTLLTLAAYGDSCDTAKQSVYSSDNSAFLSAFKNRKACDSRLRSLESLIKQAGQDVNDKRFQVLAARDLDNRGSAVAATSIEYNGLTNTIICSLANIGNTVIIVLDSKGTVKEILSENTFSISDEKKATQPLKSIPIHLIEEYPKALEVKTINLRPGDFIVQMTRGMYQTLSMSHEEYKNREIKKIPTFNRDALQKIIQGKSTKELARYDIANRLRKSIQSTLIAERKQELDTLNALKQWTSKNQEIFNTFVTVTRDARPIGTKDNGPITFQILLGKYREQLSDHIKELETYLPFLKTRESTLRSYGDLAEIPVNELFDAIKHLTLKDGDSATVSVMEVFDHELEMIRALIDSPNKHRRLVARIKDIISAHQADQAFDAELWAEQLIFKLEQETKIPEGSRGAKRHLRFQLAYTAAQIHTARYYVSRAIEEVFVEKLIDPRCTLTLEERNNLYVVFKKNHTFVPKRPCCDSLFGLRNTSSWAASLYKIRAAAYDQLEYDLELMSVRADQLELINKALQMPIFLDHRRSSCFFGNGGHTETIGRILELRRHHSESYYERPSGDLHAPLLMHAIGVERGV